jgi:hypothetical protein
MLIKFASVASALQRLLAGQPRNSTLEFSSL